MMWLVVTMPDGTRVEMMVPVVAGPVAHRPGIRKVMDATSEAIADNVTRVDFEQARSARRMG